MQIKVDTREVGLIKALKIMSATSEKHSIPVTVETLPLGDVIITDGENERLIIERKSVEDLLASIKDGRYEEQSYRLNGIPHHNHNIIYLIEGDFNRYNRFKDPKVQKIQKQIFYSSMFSINYYKGFSVQRSYSLDETCEMIYNMAVKMGKDLSKKPYYENVKEESQEQSTPKEEDSNKIEVELNDQVQQTEIEVIEESCKDKEYISVVKKVKKENITMDNIDEIMLCQIPSVSSVTAIAIIKKFGSIINLAKEYEKDSLCMDDVSYVNEKGQTRKISRPSICNIKKYLLKFG